MLRRLPLLALLVGSLLPTLALAQVPGKLGYQGRLLKADGTPASGVVKLTFRLFDKETQGAELWSETQQVGLTDGFYATFLGTVTPLPETVLDGTERFLQVDVEGEALLPRQRVGSVAYAVRASVAQSVVGGKVDASSLTVAGKTVIDSSGNLDSSISGAFAPKAHTHDAADVASGTLALGRIPQGPGSKLDADTLDGVDSKDLTKKADLSASGTINDASNPVDWTKLKNVPPSLAAATGLSSVAHDGTLSGDGTSGNPLQVSIGTAAGTVAAGDHTHSQYALDSSLTALKQALGTQGTVNDNGNPVSWTQVKDIPAGIADGVDDTGLSSISVAQPLSGDGTSAGPITLSQASAASSGFLSSGDWATFNSRLASVAVSSPLVGDGTSASPLSLTKASGSTDGYLSAADYAAFNGKLGTVSASAPLSGSGTSSSPLALSKSSGSADGYLASADFASFASKLSAVSASAPLSGAGTASSPLALSRSSAAADGYLAASDFSTFNNKLGAVSASAPLSGAGTSASPLVIGKSSASTDGYLASADFATFNNKLGAVTASAPLSGSGTSASPLVIGRASASANGYLASTDFATFNNKLDTVTASAPLSGSGTSASPLLIARATASANGYLASADFTAFSNKLDTVAASAPLSGNGTSGNPITLPKATSAVNGYLSSADFAAFNGKLSSVTATGPLTGAGTSTSPLVLPKATGTADGYLAAADWAVFNGKVGSVGAGTGVTIGGTATAPTVNVSYGTTAGTAAAGNDPRLSDARAPTAGSANYIQTSPAAAQTGSFNVTGTGLVGTSMGIGVAASQAALHVNGDFILGTKNPIPFGGTNGYLTAAGGVAVEGGGTNWATQFIGYGGGDIARFSTNTGPGQAPTVKASVAANGTITAPRFAGQSDTTNGFRSCADITLASARDYNALNSQLDTDFTGANVCGAGSHVCNYQEVSIYGVMSHCGPGGTYAWIVGGFSNIEAHRRAFWNSQDSVQCQAGNYPVWYGTQWGPYYARVHCMAGTSVFPVACCKNL